MIKNVMRIVLEPFKKCAPDMSNKTAAKIKQKKVLFSMSEHIGASRNDASLYNNNHTIEEASSSLKPSYRIYLISYNKTLIKFINCLIF